MMTGQFKIDNIDIYTTYGVYVVKGGYNGLFNLPPLKTPMFSDWQEYDGIDMLPTFFNHLDTKKFSIDFACINGLSGHDQFIRMLYAAPHDYTLPLLSFDKALRVVGESKMSFEDNLVLFTVEFFDDAPLLNYTYIAPASSLPVDNTCLLDNIPLSQYGIKVLNGTRIELNTKAALKPNMERNISIIDGVIAGAAPLTKQQKKVKLNLLIVSDDIDDFWQNWNALAYNLKEDGTRKLTINSETHDCFYNQCSIRKAIIQPEDICIEFILEFTLTNNIIHVGHYLCSDGSHYLTADGNYYKCRPVQQ